MKTDYITDNLPWKQPETMPNLIHRSNSIVIIANSHNPTIISSDFFQKTGMFDGKEIDESTVFITPAASQVRLKNRIGIVIDPEKLAITGPAEQGDKPFLIGARYCEALPYIKCRAVGINFEYFVEGGGALNIDKIFNISLEDDLKPLTTRTIQLSFKEDDYIGTLKIEMGGKLSFNYHRAYKDIIFENIDRNFSKQWESFMPTNDKILKQLFQLNQT